MITNDLESGKIFKDNGIGDDSDEVYEIIKDQKKSKYDRIELKLRIDATKINIIGNALNCQELGEALWYNYRLYVVKQHFDTWQIFHREFNYQDFVIAKDETEARQIALLWDIKQKDK